MGLNFLKYCVDFTKQTWNLTPWKQKWFSGLCCFPQYSSLNQNNHSFNPYKPYALSTQGLTDEETEAERTHDLPEAKSKFQAEAAFPAQRCWPWALRSVSSPTAPVSAGSNCTLTGREEFTLTGFGTIHPPTLCPFVFYWSKLDLAGRLVLF